MLLLVTSSELSEHQVPIYVLHDVVPHEDPVVPWYLLGSPQHHLEDLYKVSRGQ